MTSERNERESYRKRNIERKKDDNRKKNEEVQRQGSDRLVTSKNLFIGYMML